MERPKSTDFADTADGFEQYVEAVEKWKQEHPDEAAAAAEADRRTAEAEQPGAQPEEKPAETPKPAEEKPADPAAATSATAATPQAIDDLLTRNPALKAALDASPADKEVLMATARAAEAAKPILRLVPTEAEAKFAVENANQFLGMQHKFAMATEMPEVGEQAWDEFVSMFHVVDDKGNVVKDAAGMPKLTESFDFLATKINQGVLGHEVATAKSTVAELKDRVEKGVYPSEAAKQADRAKLEEAEYDLAAFDYVAKKLAADPDELQLPELPADATPAQRALQERLAKEVEQANAQRKAGTKSQRIAERKVFEGTMNQEYGRGVGNYLRNEIDARKARGEYIPDILLNRKWINPVTREQTEVADFAMQVMNQFTMKVESIPSVKDELLRLQAMGQAGKAARLARWEQLRTQYLPDIVNDYLNSVQDEVRQMAGKSAERDQKVASLARVEPTTTQQPSTPAAPTGDALEARAQELLANDPEYRAASRSERWELVMNKKEEIRAGKVR